MNILINSGRTVPYLTTRRRLISSLVEKGHNVILTGYQGGFENEMEELGVSFIKVPLSRAGFNPFKDINLLLSYYNIIRTEKIDIVHSYTIKPNIFGSIAAGLSGIKQVFPTLNGIGYAFTGKGTKAKATKYIASILYWIAFKCSRKVFFHNNDDINAMVNSHLIKRNKCVLTLGSGIDMEYYKEEKMPDSISFVLISRLLKAKGVMEYIKAAKEVKQIYPEIIFKLVGPTDPNPTGIKLIDIQRYIDSGVINYYGEQPDIRPFLKNSTVLVLPSYREGVPHIILEAMSTGRAILTTNVAGCKETVVNNENGFLVRLYSVEDLVEKMIWMIENPQEVGKMGFKSQQLARDRFEVQKVNHIIMNVMNL